MLVAALFAFQFVASAAQVTSSPAPEAVSVTIYREPGRAADRQLNLRYLEGYALISETRRVDIPAGEGAIRFEGVAGGIMPESAIVTGLPEGVVEKNQDAYLLSPGSLIERALGSRVHLRRTNSRTGEVREHEAIVRSGPDGAVVLQTEAGFEALRCSGFNETLIYPRVPEGLSAKPTLSVRTRSERAASATVTLSYLASNFDWQADYVATLAPSGDRLNLFGWVTLANGDETSFRNAGTQTVAGRVNRTDNSRPVPAQGRSIELRCWPSATTSDIETEEYEQDGGAFPPPPPPPPPAMMAPAAEAITVTGSRVRARQEELGDLKLYRIPMPVTVSAKSQKQVAMLEQPSVKVRSVYRTTIGGANVSGNIGARRLLITRNRKEEGLGLPLPAGRVVLFGAGRPRPILLGQGSLDDKAIGEDVEIDVGAATGLSVSGVVLSGSGRGQRQVELTVSNDRAEPLAYEAEIVSPGRIESGTRLVRRNGRDLWQVTVPANGRATLRYSVTDEG
jgi:hypothetical protein